MKMLQNVVQASVPQFGLHVLEMDFIDLRTCGEFIMPRIKLVIDLQTQVSEILSLGEEKSDLEIAEAFLDLGEEFI